MTERAFMSGKRSTYAFLAVIACSIMLFIEQRDITVFSAPAITLAFVFLGFYLYLFFQESRKVFLTSFFQIYFMGGLLISATSISAGARMIEVGANGDTNGTFWVILGFFIAGMEATAAGFKSRFLGNIAQKAPSQSWQSSAMITFSAAALVISLSVFILFTVGSPLIAGVDRVTFWRFFAPEYLSFVPSLVMQSYFLVAFYFLVGRKKGANPTLAALLLAAYVFITVVILGQKFSAFVLIASAWFMVLSGTFPYFKIKASYVLITSIITSFVVLLIVVSYARAGLDSDFIFTRIALQSQLMWSVLADPYGFRLTPGPDWKCLFGCGLYDGGKDFIARTYLPHGLYSYYYEGGTELSGFTPALPVLTLGLLLALCAHLIICFFLGVVQREASIAVLKENLIASFLLYKLQLGLSLIWFSALLSAITGGIAAAVLLLLYIIIFGRRGDKTIRRQKGAPALARP